MIKLVLRQIKNNIWYGLIMLFVLPFFFGGISNAFRNDLLIQLMKPARDAQTTIDLGEQVDTVGKHVIEGEFEVDITTGGIGAQKGPSVIVKATRLLLSLVVALAITMILYNGMLYIIQTGQGKEGKDLTKNIAYIVIGILVALFSVVIITLMRYVPKTLDAELVETARTRDERVLEGEPKGVRWSTIRDGIKKVF